MKSYPMVFLCAVCLCGGGCAGTRQQQQQVHALEQKNLEMEDLFYQVKHEYEAVVAENEELKRRLEAARQETGDQRRQPPSTVPSLEPNEPPPFDPGEFSPPSILLPSEPAPEGTVPESLLPGMGSARGSHRRPRMQQTSMGRSSVVNRERDSIPEPSIEMVPAAEVSLDSSRIKRIRLGPMIGALNLDERPGDDGLVIVVEPWDGSNRMLADAANISVALIDPAEPAETARFAQWEFEADEVAGLVRDGDLPGIHLELPWHGEPPRHDRLHLFVRYTTSDGRKLETDSIVHVEPGGRGRWIATDSPRVRPYEQACLSEDAAPQSPRLIAASTPSARSRTDDHREAEPIEIVSPPRPIESQTESRSTTMEEVDRSSEASPRRLPAVVEARPEPAQVDSPAKRPRPAWSPNRPW